MDIIYSIKLNKEKEEYLYKQLYNEIKKLILDNMLKAEVKLPPIRKLSQALNVNNVTVVNAYKLLEQNGYVYKKVGSGTFVKGLDIKENKKNLTNNSNIINFADASPTPDLFPVEEFKLVLNDVLDRDKGNAFGYQEIQGYSDLRNSIKNYINKYGINTKKDSIQIVSGAQQGIDIISKTLIDYGDIVFTESPTYTGAIAAFKSRSARIIEVPILNDGIDIKTLENKLLNFRPKFIYVMPNFQNPTGYSYSNYKKEKLLELANKYNTLIIEDDYLSELSFTSKKNTTLKTLDRNDKVIYIKSFSKIFMPGLRLGFAIIPDSLSRDVLSAKHTSDISTSGLIQRAFNLYLKKNKWEKHLIEMEAIYKKRYRTMQECIEKYLPNEIKYSEPKGGLNFWFSLPDGYLSEKLYLLCKDKDILFIPGSNFYVKKKYSKYFRLSIASVSNKNIEKGMKMLSEIIEKFLKDPKNKNLTEDYKTLI
ncbi:MAG: PLP-dependent aminotransferase family protein [Firmicutes bacterium]|nr:PLP-dependent aminotransferase family protein [Bacillota bacterium]